jgi:DNA (cytosine-5)-methyltransferase 1
MRRFGGGQAFVIPQQSGGAPRSVQDPLPTLAAKGAVSLIEPFLVAYYGTGGAQPVSRPVPTITARDRFGLVEPSVADIRFRMLQPHELAAAMSFPADYQFRGNRTDVIRQIGNAVPVGTAQALCAGIIDEAVGRAVA